MSEIGQRRLYAQRITGKPFKGADAVAEWLGALQGQDYAGAKWSFGLRLGRVTEAEIERMLVDGVILRTWAVRGTLHYVAPTDIHWLLTLIAPRLIAGNARRYRQLELDEPTLVRSTVLLTETLADGQLRSRSELFAMLEANGIRTTGQRGVYLLQRAALERQIYQGPVRRGETTFRALADGPTLLKDQALTELARRYFTSRGPATLNDFTAWSGLLASEARAGLEGVQAELVEETMDGQRYFRSPEALPAPDPAIHLLPGFDEFVLGYRDRRAILDADFADAICPGGNGMFMPTLVSQGRIIGTWKRTLMKTTVVITCMPFHPLSAEEYDKVSEAAARYGNFVGLTPIVTVSAA